MSSHTTSCAAADWSFKQLTAFFEISTTRVLRFSTCRISSWTQQTLQRDSLPLQQQPHKFRPSQLAAWESTPFRDPPSRSHSHFFIPGQQAITILKSGSVLTFCGGEREDGFSCRDIKTGELLGRRFSAPGQGRGRSPAIMLGFIQSTETELDHVK